MNPIKASLRYPVVTLLLVAVLVSSGLWAVFKMPRQEDPTITIRTGIVLALYPGATSEQVEKQVTRTLEEHIFKFPEVRKEKTYSTSRPGLCVINVELEDNVKNSDVFWAKLRHEMAETKAQFLPQEVQGPLVNSDFGDTVAMLIAVHGSRYGHRELRDYVDRIEDELRGIRDVGKLARYGGQNEEIIVGTSLERMAQYSADPARVMLALRGRNIIESSGNLEADKTKVGLRATGSFTGIDQVRNLLVDVSRDGQPLYIRDFSSVERRYQDPVFITRFNGEPSEMISVEMQRGKNIVELGEQVSAAMARLRPLLPPDLKIDLVADQPTVVDERMHDMGREFTLAIVSVILVTLILLPMRVAVIAAVAIPVTISTTVGVMNLVGMQLHQVSIAALIVVLGIVVDDAIVIADNYVELLDHEVPVAEAAWRSASEMFVPVLTATLTIIASFLPLLILTGSSGEFICALPITVAIALSVSFIVAILVTPLLCRFFIKTGLHSQAPEEGKKPKRTMLDRLQTVYNIAIAFFMKRKILAVAMGVFAFAMGLVLMRHVPTQFFPLAERNQCVIDVWMPEGTRIEATDEAMRRIEHNLGSRPEVTQYSSFVGQSAPRFYYNVNPQQPDGAYGQIIVKTKSAKITPEVVAKLRSELPYVVPEAQCIVKELQQGSQMEAPLEVRISGDNVEQLKSLAHQVEDIVRQQPAAEFVHNDYYADSYFVDVAVNDELANRSGLTNTNVAKVLAGGFDGQPVSTFWEGNRAVTIKLRLDPAYRQTFGDVGDTYVPSVITSAKLPIRALATLEPQWQTSRIVRRNGVYTVTVRAFPKRDHYASELLNGISGKVKDLPLPAGFHITYGGEFFNQNETFPEMTRALAISLGVIFLILLIQFRSVSDTIVVMASIPLMLFGAVVGLLVTHNPFGFTAFMGLISLCGIVVRNGIVLVDYIIEKMREGRSLEKAATEAGERRLRPIFLTTMAAAVGVTPMILSRSSLWSPLASVIAFGLIFSMFFTLLVVPVLFVLINSHKRSVPPQAAAALLLLAMLVLNPVCASAQQTPAATQPSQVQAVPDAVSPVKLTLQKAVELALKQNRSLKIARAKVKESDNKVVTARADLYPQLSNDATVIGISNLQAVEIPRGALGTITGQGPFPNQTVKLDQGSNAVLLNNTTVTQSISQLYKIRAGVRAASADVRVAKDDLQKSEDEVTLAVHQLYYGLLVSERQRRALIAARTAAEERLRESQDSVQGGVNLEVANINARASLLSTRQELLTEENQISDLNEELNDLLGLPLGTELQLEAAVGLVTPPPAREECQQAALSNNPELKAAKEEAAKARAGLDAAHDEYIPDFGAYYTHTYQNGVPFLTHNNDEFGAKLTWRIFDAGRRRGVVGERMAQLEQAQQNVQRIESQIAVDLDKAYRKVERSKTMIEVAQESLTLRRESERIAKNQATAGVIQQSQYAEAISATAKAEAEELQAQLGYELAISELNKVVGVIQ
jgi:multidrug efflux pump subunit AcrB/outer membrane protein TolC